MKLFGALLACASALTDDEIAAFKCRSGTYAQYDRVSTNGGTEMNRRASNNNNWDGCHYNQQLPCYKNEFECEVAMTSVSSGTRLQIISNGIPDHSAWAMTGQTSIITEKNYAFRVPKVPVLLPLNQATDANQGAVGYATNGVAIFGPYNSGCCDATFEEIQTVDYCLGHPANGAYHYHYFSKELFHY